MVTYFLLESKKRTWGEASDDVLRMWARSTLTLTGSRAPPALWKKLLCSQSILSEFKAIEMDRDDRDYPMLTTRNTGKVRLN